VALKMRMYKAAEKALNELGKPTHTTELYEYMEEKGYFTFGAKDPGSALYTCLARHSIGATISRSESTIKLFYRAAPSTFGLIKWLNKEQKEDIQTEQKIVDKEIQHELDCSLFLEEDWQKWLFKNVKDNGLSKLGYSQLSFYNQEYQEQHSGHYNTNVGEIDFLLRAKNGDFVVLELKRKGDDATVGQICRYVGWVKQHLAKNNEKVYGVILAGQISDKLRYAIEVVHEDIYFQQIILNAEFGESSKNTIII